jgi:hypothetical protein
MLPNDQTIDRTPWDVPVSARLAKEEEGGLLSTFLIFFVFGCDFCSTTGDGDLCLFFFFSLIRLIAMLSGSIA